MQFKYAIVFQMTPVSFIRAKNNQGYTWINAEISNSIIKEKNDTWYEEENHTAY